MQPIVAQACSLSEHLQRCTALSTFFVVYFLSLSCIASSSFLMAIVSSSALRRAIAASKFFNSAVFVCAVYLVLAVCTSLEVARVCARNKLSSFAACLCRFR